MKSCFCLQNQKNHRNNTAKIFPWTITANIIWNRDLCHFEQKFYFTIPRQASLRLAEIAFSSFTHKKGKCHLFHNAGPNSAVEVEAEHTQDDWKHRNRNYTGLRRTQCKEQEHWQKKKKKKSYDNQLSCRGAESHSDPTAMSAPSAHRDSRRRSLITRRRRPPSRPAALQ